MYNIEQYLLDKSIFPKSHNIKRYLKFIDFCKNIEFSGYIENHHIIPKSFGGSDDKSNIIKLGARHHYIAHLLLAKGTNNPKMIKALHKMIYSMKGDVHRNYKITSRIYAYIREEHSKIVSNYSKNTVVAEQIYTGEIKRIPKKLFDYYNGVLYKSIAKGRKDNQLTKDKKRTASQKPRKVKKGLRSRSLAASKYSYETPKGFCDNRQDVLYLYPTFSKETLHSINKDNIISKKFVSIHSDFLQFVGLKWSDIGFKKINRK